MTVPLVLSASSLQTYLRCPKQWYFAYVAEYRNPPSIKQVLGIAAHEAIEANMAQKVWTWEDLPVSDVLDAFSTSYDRGSVEVERADEDPGKAKDSGVKLVRLHHEQVAPAIQPAMVEEPIQFEINGVPYSGIIDLVDDRGKVRDWKTTGKSPSPGQYMLNMVGYAIGYRQATGQVESEVVLDYLVRTTKPKHVPIASGGPVSDEAIVRFSSVVRDVADAINAGSFVPNGLANGACSWCGYKHICTSYREEYGTVTS